MRRQLLLTAFIVLSACKDNSACDPTQQPRLQVKFYTLKKIPDIRLGFQDSAVRLTVNKLFGLGAKNDSLIYLYSTADSAARSGFSLPVSNLDSVSRYVFRINKNAQGLGLDSVSDTLTISYAKQLKYISQGCGYSYSYTIRSGVSSDQKLFDSRYKVSLTNNFFFRVNCTEPTISDGKENIKIYFNR